jgi:hypothetical protein
MENINTKVHKTVIVSVLFVCETWALVLAEENCLRVFEKMRMRVKLRERMR